MYTVNNCCKMASIGPSTFVRCCALLLLLQTITYVTAATDVRFDQSKNADSDNIYEILEDEQFFIVDKKFSKQGVQVSKKFNVTSPPKEEHLRDKTTTVAETTTDSVRTSPAVHHAGITSHAEHDDEFVSELLDDYLIFSQDMEQVDMMEEQRREQERELARRVRRQVVGSGAESVDVVLTLNYTWNANFAVTTSAEFKNLNTKVEAALTSRLSSSVTVIVNAFRQGSTVVEFTVSFANQESVDRVALARQMLTIKRDGLSIDGKNYSVLAEPSIETDSNVPKASTCYLCRSYQECLNNNTDYYCQVSSSDFFKFGRTQDDEALEKNLERYAKKVEVPAGIPVVDQTIKDVWVSSNGLISFDKKYGAFSPRQLPRPDRTLMCGYWSDMLLLKSDSTSSVWYHAYQKNSNNTAAELAVLTEANNAVDLYGDVTKFSATFVLVVTYEEMPPDPTSIYTTERVNFQMVLISDGAVTYGMFIYASGGMQWHEVLRRRVTIGYLNQNLDISTAKPDTEIGNTNRRGVWFFKLGERPKSSQQKCLDWYNENLPQRSSYINTIMPRCPCNYLVAFFTNFWIPEYTGNEFLPRCFITPPFYGEYGKRCCYTSDLRYERNRPEAGSFLLHHPWLNKAKNYAKDVLPKKHCCEQSNLCALYYDVRPTDSCQGFFIIIIAVATGDPHITTLDGKVFAFNAIGEFTLIHLDQPRSANNTQVNFDFQTRTCQAKSSQGDPVQASIFCGFVAKGNNSDTLQVELNLNGDGLIIYANNQELTLQFQEEGDSFTRNFGELILRRTNNTLRATFQEGININITVQYQLLTLSVGVDYLLSGLSGLLGNKNGNPEDDYIFPNGTILPGNTSERVLLEYGKTWAVTNVTSLFTYRPGFSTLFYTNDSFEPIFLSEVPEAKRTEAETKCGGTTDLGCIFDYIATGNEQLAVATKQATADAEKNRLTANNSAPVLDGPTQVNVTINEDTTITLNASDTEGQAITYSIISKPSTGFTFNNQTETAVWRPTDNTTTKLEFAVVDSAGAQSESLKIEVVLCSGCNGQGHCNFSTLRTQTTVDEYFKQAVCVCEPYYDGDDCEHNLDACAEEPCPVNTICTDFTISEHIAAGTDSSGYNCTSCPAGYITNTTTRNCYDIDECFDASPCNQKCTNVIGSFYCGCNFGYRLVPSTSGSQPTQCSDIDECTESTSGCAQECTNTAGSYECSCYSGFTLGANNRTCTKNPATDPCANLANTCEYACKNVSGAAVCQCSNGYALAANGYNCTDVNECSHNLCSQNCNNTAGSYTCSCYVGYYLDVDKVTCTPCAENRYGVNCASTCECKGRGTCDHVRGCQCSSAWTGSTCSQDVNECLTIPNACSSDQTCVNTNGSYVCNCPTGFQKVNSTCVDIDECADPTLHNCAQVCTNTPGSYVCSCRSGYTYTTGNNSCTDIDECATASSHCAQLCVNYPGSANCECRVGFVLEDDRKNCMKERDPCAVLSDAKNCSYGCEVSQSGVATCFCPNGYEVAVDGVSCVDTNECNNQTTNHCSQQCDNSPGSYVCSCSTGYSLDNNQRDCDVCDAYHWGVNCSTQCNCNPQGTSTCNSVTGCVCKVGWLGDFCQLDRDECSNSDPCPANAACTDTAGSYRCDCRAGYTFNTAADTCIDVDECARNPCDQTCTNTVGSYTCSCANGFNSVGDTCVDINECLSNPCDQTCRNTVGGFACGCLAGFLLNTTTRTTCYVQKQCVTKSCEQGCRVVNGTEECVCHSGYTINASNSSVCDDINECSNSPCINGTCLNIPGAFTCTCLSGRKLLSDGVTCQPCTQGTYGAGCANTCACNTTNTRSCDVVTGTCTCNTGWSDTNCNTDIDECRQNTTICGGVANSTCVNTQGSYSCECKSGFFTSGGVCHACDDTSYGTECLQRCNCVLAHTLNCGDITGACQCNSFWKGANCSLDVDECANTSICNAARQFETCRNFDGGYSCDCVSGYHRPSPGSVCADLDECLYTNLNTCNKTTEVCVNTPGAFSCSCRPGFELRNNVCADVNECLNSTLNNCTTKENCKNSVGGFSCTCKDGYTRASFGVCSDTLLSSNLTITLDIKPDENVTHIKNSTYYHALLGFIETSLRDFFNGSIGGPFHDFVVTNLRSGSVIVDGILQIDANDTSNVEGLAAKGVEDLVEAVYLTVNDTRVNVSRVDYNGQTVAKTLLLCQTFSLFKNCSSNQQCAVDGGVPFCRVVQESDSDSYKLIIGLAVGIPLFFIVVIIIAVLIFMCVRRGRRQEHTRAEPSEDRFRSVFASQIPTKGSWGAARQYQMYSPDTMSVATSGSSGEGQLIKGRQQGRTDFQDSAWYDTRRASATDVQRGQQRTPRDGVEEPTSNFSWEYMFRLLEPYRGFEIQRPAVQASPNPAYSPRRTHPDSLA